MPHRIRWEDEGFFAEFSGEVSSWEIDAVNEAFTGDPRFDTVRFALWDMSGIVRLTISDGEIETAAATDKGASIIRRSLRGAIVVPAGHVRERVEHYLAVSGDLENTWDTRLFDDIESALRWLSS